MKTCHDIQDLMYEVLAGTAAEGERLRLDAHLASCDACRREWALLQQITAHPGTPSDPGEAFWAGYHDRLVERMALESHTVASKGRVFQLIPRPLMQVAAALVLVTMGVLIGRSGVFDEQSVSTESVADTELVELEEQAWSVLNRSRTVLLAVANFDASQDLPSDLNLDRRQAAATELVRETADLRARLSETDRQRLSNLLSDLEVILLQLAHLDAQVDVPQIEMMQQGLDRKALLFKIDIESMNRATEAPPPSPSTNSSPEPRRSAI